MWQLNRRALIVAITVASMVALVKVAVSREPAGATEKKLEIEKPRPGYSRHPIHPPPEIMKRLENPFREPQPLVVPEATRLLSRGKPVTSSARNIVIGALEMITDGEKNARDENVVEVGLGVHWVQIDLGRPVNVHAVVLWHDHRFMWIYRDVIVQVSNDVEFEDGVTTVFNSDDDGSGGHGEGKDKLYVESHHGKAIDAKGTKGRYVRLYSNGSMADDMNHYTEVEVYGVAGE